VPAGIGAEGRLGSARRNDLARQRITNAIFAAEPDHDGVIAHEKAAIVAQPQARLAAGYEKLTVIDLVEGLDLVGMLAQWP
jgi:hypothetical protein